MKFTKKRKELSVRARRRGVLWFISALFHSISQTSFVFVVVFFALLWATNSLTSYLGPGKSFDISEVIILPDDDTDIEQIKSAIGIKKGDSINEDKINAIKTQLNSYGWIKDHKLNVNARRQLEIQIIKKSPFARVQFMGRSESNKLDNMVQFIDDELELFEPANETLPAGSNVIPMVQYDGPVPAGANSKNLPDDLRSMAEFLHEYYRSKISRSFRIKNSMVSGQTYFVEFDHDIRMNLINPDPASLVPYVETILRRIPLNELKKHIIFIKNSRDIIMKKRSPLELKSIFEDSDNQ